MKVRDRLPPFSAAVNEASIKTATKLAVLLLLGAAAAPAARAQEAPAELEAGGGVEAVEIRPAAPLSVGMGDTLKISLLFLDAQGDPVHDFRWGFQFSPSIAGARPDPSTGPDSFEIWGMKPGRTSLQVGVLVADDDGNPSPKVIESFEVMIEDWPVARVEIDAPAFAAFAGTTFRMTAHAVTTKETVHATASPVWRSETPDVAAVTASGVVTFLRPGTARLTASAGGTSAGVTLQVVENPVREVRLTPSTASARTGDVVRFELLALDGAGREVSDVAISYAIQSIPASDDPGAVIFEDGAFVAERPGAYRVFASAGSSGASAVV
ncbi:MAG: hypothetical protein V3S91_04350, partial [Gemmatimonadota bacterium]